MVNFRYHLVSLVAVFVALAIGVVLGAGPLQQRIAASTGPSTSQDAQAAAQAQLAAARSGLETQDKAITELAGTVLPDTLPGVRVVTVALPGSSTDDLAAVREDLSAAGAQVVGSVSLTANWDSQSMAQYRETLAGPVATHLSGAGPSDATSDAVIGYALVEVLTSTGSEQGLLRDILTDRSTPIMTVDQDPKGTAEAFVVVGPRASGTGEDATAAPADQAASGATSDAQSGGSTGTATAWGGLARAVASAPRGAVVLGDASSADALVAQIRSQKVGVTTVDTVGTQLGAFSAVLALHDAGQKARSYGVGEGASSVLPPIPGLS